MSHTSFVLLLDPPVFTKKPRTVHAYQYTNVRFDCLADGIPTPRITWSKTGDIIGNTDYTTVGDGYLLIKDIVFSDMGSYQCFVENYFGKIQETVERLILSGLLH